MIAFNKKTSQSESKWHADFLKMLPAIEQRTKIGLRLLGGDEAREEAMQEVVANTLVAYLRLVELGKADQAYARRHYGESLRLFLHHACGNNRQNIVFRQ